MAHKTPNMHPNTLHKPPEFRAANHAQTAAALQDLRDLLQLLRKQCPWDKEQTMQSLTLNTVEEMYELLEAIDRGNWTHIQEELGDLVEHILFYSMLAEEAQAFDLATVLRATHAKLVSRHPHIFGNAPKLSTTQEVLRQWEQLKGAEGRKSLLGNLPKNLPTLAKTLRLQEKSSRIGFDFNTAEEAWGKILEEQGELAEAVAENSNKEEEIGDLLFAVANYARHIGVDADRALRKSNAKFVQRFQALEALIAEENLDLHALSVKERVAVWTRAKQRLSSNSQNLNA